MCRLALIDDTTAH